MEKADSVRWYGHVWRKLILSVGMDMDGES